MESLTGKKAIITGGARGVGKATALALAKEGVEVGLIARTTESLAAVCDTIQAAGGKAYYAAADVSDYKAATAAVNELQNQMGKIDILVNNAAIAEMGSVIDMDHNKWEDIIRVNLFGVYYVTKALLPQLIEQKSGDIVTVASTAGTRANANASAYSASKFAVIGFMESLMYEVRQHNIRVHTIAPSTIATDMADGLGIVSNRDSIMQPEDLAQFIVHELQLNKRIFVKSATLWATNP